MAKKKMNVKLLRRIQRHVIEVPKRLDMECFLDRTTDSYVVHKKMPECGTVGCIAGWAVALSTKELVPYVNIASTAAKFLSIREEEAEKLFYPHQWPEEFEDRLREAKPQTLKHAQLTVERIDHFIKTGE